MKDKEQDKYIEYIASHNIDRLEGEELDRFQIWLESSPKNKKILKQTKDAWDLASLLNYRTRFSSEDGWEQFDKKRKASNNNFTISSLRIVASIVIAFTLGALGYYLFNRTFLNKNLEKTEMFETVVPNGSKAEIFLADGTKVWLNAGTSLKYSSSYNKNKRDVFLNGEAYFDVEKDPEHPFIVHIRDIEVKAVGTSFNVKAYANEKTIETTLVEGKVLISKKNLEESIIMSPNQKLTFVNNDKDFAYSLEELKLEKSDKAIEEEFIVSKKAKNAILETEVDIKPEISWKDNEWFISGMSLEELAINLQRRYDVKIGISDDELKKYRFSGTILNESLEQVLSYINRVAPIDYKVNGKEVVFSVNKKFKNEHQKMLKTINN